MRFHHVGQYGLKLLTSGDPPPPPPWPLKVMGLQAWATTSSPSTSSLHSSSGAVCCFSFLRGLHFVYNFNFPIIPILRKHSLTTTSNFSSLFLDPMPILLSTSQFCIFSGFLTSLKPQINNCVPLRHTSPSSLSYSVCLFVFNSLSRNTAKLKPAQSVPFLL